MHPFRACVHWLKEEFLSTSEILNTLIKEGSHNIRTFTKLGHPEKIHSELVGIRFFEALGFSVPQIIATSETMLTIEFIEGPSAFRILELAAERNDDRLIYGILDCLCSFIASFQERAHELELSFLPYEIHQKVTEIALLLEQDDRPLATEN